MELIETVYNNFDNFIKYEKNKIDAVVLILPKVY